MPLVLQRTRKSAQYFTQTIADGISIEMVYIPSGEFLMGSPEDEEGRRENESPQHRVKVPAFFMGKYPVTQAQWRAVASLPRESRDIERNPSHFKGDDLPVEQVSWLDASEFCARLSRKAEREYRLPSEAEWEYACRALPISTTGTLKMGDRINSGNFSMPFHFGETISSEVANYDARSVYGQGTKGEYRGKTTPVGSFQVANRFGLYDMHGNVWEWCLDHWHENYENAPTDGSAWLDPNASEDAKRLLRGGSWDFIPRYCRSAYRSGIGASNRSYLLGFRLVSPARILL